MNARHTAILTAMTLCLSCPVHAAPSVTDGSVSTVSLQSTEASEVKSSAKQPAFPKELPGKPDKKALQNIQWKITEAFSSPYYADPEDTSDITILGRPTATQEQMVNFIQKHNENPLLTCSLRQLVSYYYEEAGREGIRADIALCQAIKETGYFGYGGDVDPSQNNFCGLGATGNHEPGCRFSSARLGVRAHIQHLLAYASTDAPAAPVIDPRYRLILDNHPEIFGQLQLWTDLNGVWAVPGTTYGQDILFLWRSACALDDSDASLQAVTREVRNHPTAKSYNRRGVVYLKQKKYTEAALDFTRAIELQDSIAYRYNRALALTKTEPASAIEDYSFILENDRTNTKAYYNRGLLLLNAKKYDEAILDFEAMLAVEAQHAEARNNIGILHVLQKKYKEAWQDFYEAGQINTNNQNVLENQKLFLQCLKKK